MSNFRMLLGRAGSGKTETMIREIKSRLQDNPQGDPLVLLVPEQATFQMERALMADGQAPGLIRAQVLSFRRMAWRVMQECGGTAKVPIDETGKHMLLYKVISRNRQRLRQFRRAADGQLGLLAGLVELHTEFQRYCIGPDRLRQHIRSREAELELSGRVDGLGEKLGELELMFREFGALLEDGYADAETWLGWLAEQAGQSSWIRRAEIWVDGFHGFTPKEFAALESLIAHSAGVTVSLCADRDYDADHPPQELDLFYPPASTAVRLNGIIAAMGRGKQTTVLSPDIPPRYAGEPVLAHLERGLVEPRTWEGGLPASSPLAVHAAANRRAEVEAAAREMLRLARDEGARWRDMLLLVRNGESYHDVLAAVLADYDIPCFFDRKRPVTHHPLVEFIRSAIDVVRRNWRYEDIFRCVRTDFLLELHDDPARERAERQAFDRLENAVLYRGVQGMRSWKEERQWGMPRSSALDPDQIEAPAHPDDAADPSLEECRRKITGPLSEFHRKVREAVCVRQMAEAVYLLLEAVRVPARLELWSLRCLDQGRPEQAREHGQIWGLVVDLLDQAVELMGEEAMSPDLFAGMLEAGLDSLRLGLVPPSLDQVLVGDLERTRTHGVKHLFVLGAGDGVLPARMGEGGVLTEQERELLSNSGLELAPGNRRKLMDESFLIYTMLAIPSRGLWISYPLADEEGGPLLPSPVIGQLERLFPGLNVRTAHEGPAANEEAAAGSADDLGLIVKPDQGAALLTVRLREWMRGGYMSPVWWSLYNWLSERPQWHDELREKLKALFYHNQEQPLSASTVRALYGDRLTASVSRLEQFGSCAFAHFASYGLRLRERKIYRLETPDIGQLFHAALTVIARELERDGKDWGMLGEEACRERARAAVDVLAPRLLREILFSSRRYMYIQHKLREVVARTASVLGEHASRSRFRPVGLELPFGPGQMIPAPSFRLKGGNRVELAGRIDRIDAAEAGDRLLLRVIDYKSGNVSLNMAEVYHGISLQVLTYLDIAVSAAKDWLGREAEPAGVFYFHVHNPLLNAGPSLPPEDIRQELLKKYKLKGLLLAEPEVARLMDSRLDKGHSPVIPAGLKADGEFYRHSSVADAREWKAIRRYVREKIRSSAEQIASGEVDIAPYKLGPKTACAWCAYKPVCQFDPLAEGGGRFRVLDGQGKEELRRMMTEKGEEEHDGDREA